MRGVQLPSQDRGAVMKKYKTIYADPPWPMISGVGKFANGLLKPSNQQFTGINITKHSYKSMSIKDLCNVSIPTAEACALFMWTVSMFLPQALKVGKAWGFRYSTVAFIWIKQTNNGNISLGKGTYTLPGAEICLLFTKGTILKEWKNHITRQVVFAERTGHSIKPACIRTAISCLLPGPRLELFARTKTKGWDVFGDQVKDSIKLRGIE